MKTLLLLLVLLSVATIVLGEEFSLVGNELLAPFPGPYSIEFLSSSELMLRWESGEANSDYLDLSKSYPYEIIQRGKLSFLSIDGQLPTTIETGMYSEVPEQDYGNEFLLLLGKSASGAYRSTGDINHYLGFSRQSMKVNGYDGTRYTFLSYFPNYEGLSRRYYACSSFLSESGTEYSVENLNRLEPDQPWVEGARGHGIGENFVVENLWGEVYSHLLIINGFISSRNPNLYGANGRVKTLLVEGVDSGRAGEVDVLDTPHPQTVDISFIEDAEDIKVTILEVYPGSLYEDTSIHFLITYNEEVLPYIR